MVRIAREQQAYLNGYKAGLREALREALREEEGGVTNEDFMSPESTYDFADCYDLLSNVELLKKGYIPNGRNKTTKEWIAEYYQKKIDNSRSKKEQERLHAAKYEALKNADKDRDNLYYPVSAYDFFTKKGGDSNKEYTRLELSQKLDGPRSALTDKTDYNEYSMLSDEGLYQGKMSLDDSDNIDDDHNYKYGLGGYSDDFDFNYGGEPEEMDIDIPDDAKWFD